MKITVGIRPSNLSLRQAEEAIELIKEVGPHIEIEIKKIKTSGDIDKNTPLTLVDKEDFFTDAIDYALRKGDIDIAIHSAKDLPLQIDSKFEILFITESPNPFDALVSKNNLKINELPFRACIGTSSKSRKEQLLK